MAIVATPVVAMVAMGPLPVVTACPACHMTGMTVIRYEIGLLCWIFVIVLLFVCFCLAWLPCIIDGCKDVHHHCSSCGALVGVYRRL